MVQMSITKRALIVMAAITLCSLTGCKIKGQDAQNTENGAPVAVQAPAADAAAAAAAPAAPAAAPVAIDNNVPMPLQVRALPLKGNPDALVTIVEFSDYECPFCSRVEPTIEEIMKAYPNDVRVAFINNPLPFHKNAMPAAKAAVAAANQGKHWEMHAALFANQKALSVDFFKAKAQELGLDVARFEADMNSPATEALINKGIKDGQPFGVGGTPSFLINGVVFVGAQPLDNFKKVIDAELARAKQVAADKKLAGEDLYKELVKTAPKPPAEEEEEAPAGRVLVDLSTAPILGNVDAPVTLVEFTDFECPFCLRANKTVHELINKPENAGKVRLAFRHYPLPFHKNAKLAHQAAEAAKAQGKFWEYYDKLFPTADDAARPGLDRDSLIKYAEELGLDKDKFVADMDSDAVIKIVEGDVKAGGEAGVRGTPHFFFNGTLLSGAQPINAFQAALDKEFDLSKPYTEKGLKGTALYEQIVKDNPVPKPAPIVIDIAGAPFKGAENAPVTIIQFSEFQCPFCSRVEPTIKALLEDPAYTGKIKVVFKQFPLPFHNNAQKAAEAALFANANGKFWEMHEKMFANQNALDIDSLKKYATEVGLDAAAMEAALSSDQYKAAVEADVKAGQGAGISGTPSFVINGKLFVGAQPIDNFKHEIDEALKAN